MSDLRSSNIYDMLDEDGGASAAIPKKDAKSTPAEKPSNKKVDAPPKKEKPAKNEEPAAPLGKEQRGAGRDSKPRGRGRDNKGGLRRPAGSGREFDRRSGPSATHRNPREGKRHGGGQHNWGDAVEEGTKAAQTTGDETPASPPPPADENKTDAAAATTENKDAATEVKEPQEEEDKTLTYDQFLSKKKQQAPEGDKLEARQPDNDAFEGHSIIREVTSEKKNKKKPQQEEEDEKADKAGARKKKNIVTLDEFNAHTQPAGAIVKAPREPRPPRTEAAGGERGGAPAGGDAGAAARGGRGRGRGRGGARGGGRGRGGGRAQGPELTQEMFPKLGK